MRLLHTSDWHVGKVNYSQPRESDHDRIFEQIYGIAKDEAVDVILHTGDLFDKAEPGPEILRRGFDYIERLAEIAPVVLLVGNHDSDGIFALVDAIIRRRKPAGHPIHIVHKETLRGENVGVLVLSSRDGRENIRIGSVPFVKSPSYAKQMLAQAEEPIGLIYADQLARLEAAVGRALNVGYDSKTDIRIFAAHLLVNGATIGGADRGERKLEIEFDSFGTNGDSIPIADYVAFGHVHKSQPVPGRTQQGRYAGSPLAVDFGETGEEKGVYVVEARPGLPASRIDFVKLDVGREMVTETIAYSDLAARGTSLRNKIVKVRVLLKGNERNVADYVSECLPGAFIAKIEPQYEMSGEQTHVIPTGPERTMPELFASYLDTVPNVRQPEVVSEYFSTLYTAVDAGSTPRIAELDDL